MRQAQKELKDKTVEGLEKEIKSIQDEVKKLLVETRVQPQKDMNGIGKKKRKIAQLLTELQKKRSLKK